jgi:hypothetical protein
MPQMMNKLKMLKNEQQNKMLFDEHQIFPKDEFVLIVLERLYQVVDQQDHYPDDLQELYG